MGAFDLDTDDEEPPRKAPSRSALAPEKRQLSRPTPPSPDKVEKVTVELNGQDAGESQAKVRRAQAKRHSGHAC
jgi:hypothetical protein